MARGGGGGGGGRVTAAQRRKAQRQDDAQRRQVQWAKAQELKLRTIDNVFNAANDYMLDRYDRAQQDERWVPPRAEDESHASYYQRRGRHQASIEEFAAPLRERAFNGHTLRPGAEAHYRQGTKPTAARGGGGGGGSSDSGSSSGGSSDSEDGAAPEVSGGTMVSAFGMTMVVPAASAGSGRKVDKGMTLQQAATDGDTEMVRMLLARGGDVDGKIGDVAQETALHVAAQFGRTTIVDMLLKAGAQVDDLDLAGQTPLHGAASAGHVDIVRVLMLQGARLNCVDKEGNTPLHCAARFGQTDVVRMLIRGVGRARSGSRGGSGGGLGWHEAQWALAAKNKSGKTPPDMSKLASDGGEAVFAVLAEFSATQAAAKSASELRASTATGGSLAIQLQVRILLTFYSPFAHV